MARYNLNLANASMEHGLFNLLLPVDLKILRQEDIVCTAIARLPCSVTHAFRPPPSRAVSGRAAIVARSGFCSGLVAARAGTNSGHVKPAWP
eukprot:526148-Pleurochrysis_carterae.AAC.1